MSLSKEQLMVAAGEQPLQPKCTRCRHHGIIVPQRGHIKYCPFLKCDCWKCYLVTQRTRITALRRNLKRTQEQRPCAHTGVVTPAAVEGTCCASAPDGGARPSATSGLTCPSSGGGPEPAAATASWSPLDLRSRPGLESRKVLPSASSEEGPCKPFSPPYFSEFGQTAPLPVIHFPFWMPGHYPSSYAPCPNFLLNMPWLPPVPAGLYNNGLCGPLMPPHFQPGTVRYPPPPEPGPAADGRQVLFTLPEPFHEEVMLRQPPLSKNPEQDTEELI
ncbi:doublesex- and mab-3-related transcription factor 1Y-like [Enoplosus armatus]|uniref:doublesex- and mab-3-related transcription factor 1Y-like n=1 Tax=Enoplosus armatus TaxID=215367 RepID=UPI0039939724